MSSLLAIPLILLGEFSLHVAPERKYPLSYTDEPLLVKITDAPTGAFEVTGTITDALANVTDVSIGTVRFRANESRYLTIPHEPSFTGHHVVSLSINDEQAQAGYYRIRHPSVMTASPFRVTFTTFDRDTLESSLNIPLSEARLFASDPQLDDAITRMHALKIRMHLVVHQAEHPATDKRLEEWVTRYGNLVSWWEFESTDDLPELYRLMRSLLRLQPQAKLSIRVNSPENLEHYLSVADKPSVTHIVVTESPTEESQTSKYSIAAEIAGLEMIPVTLDDGAEDPIVLWRHLTSGLTSLRPISIDIPAVDIDAGAGLEHFSVYNQWAWLLAQHEPVGPFFIGDEVSAYLFRHVSQDKPWVMALSANSPTTLELPDALVGASIHSSTTMQSAESLDTIALEALPTFITGTDRTAIDSALRNALALDANLLLAVESYAPALSPAIIEVLKQLKTSTPDTPVRDTFFLLLRQLPELERQLKSETLPAHVAIPVVSKFARIARLICALEQEAGNAFLEPAVTTLNRSNEFLAEFLSNGSPAAQRSRDQQLVAEITRLMAESETAQESERPIESAGIAIIAEWRARSLLAQPD